MEGNNCSAPCGVSTKAPEPVVLKVGDTMIVSKYKFGGSLEPVENNLPRDNRDFYEIEIKRIVTPKVSFEDKV